MIWSTIEPTTPIAAGGKLALSLGPVRLELSPAPTSHQIEPINPGDHRLRAFHTTLYRLSFDYQAGADALALTTTLLLPGA